jgi:transcriptional regulator with XRE-family HTH domain
MSEHQKHLSLIVQLVISETAELAGTLTEKCENVIMDKQTKTLDHVCGRIVFIQETLGYNTRQFAIELGISPAVLGNITRYRQNNPSFEMINRILQRFPRINAEWLIMGTGQPFKGDLGSIHDRIDTLLRRYNITTAKTLAETCGIPMLAATNLINKVEEPAEATLHQILKTYPEISTSWLINGIGDMLLIQSHISKLTITDTLKSILELNSHLAILIKEFTQNEGANTTE